jgi:hypothetical protein
MPRIVTYYFLQCSGILLRGLYLHFAETRGFMEHNLGNTDVHFMYTHTVTSTSFQQISFFSKKSHSHTIEQPWRVSLSSKLLYQ